MGLPRIPAVDFLAFPAGGFLFQPVGGDDLAVQDQVRQALPYGAFQGLAQARCPRLQARSREPAPSSITCASPAAVRAFTRAASLGDLTGSPGLAEAAELARCAALAAGTAGRQ